MLTRRSWFARAISVVSAAVAASNGAVRPRLLGPKWKAVFDDTPRDHGEMLVPMELEDEIVHSRVLWGDPRPIWGTDYGFVRLPIPHRFDAQKSAELVRAVEATWRGPRDAQILFGASDIDILNWVAKIRSEA